MIGDADLSDVDGDLPTITNIPNPAFTAGSKVALTKIGTGIQTLGGANTYTGATTINGGTLSITGSLDPNQAVAVNTGGTLSGAGDGASTGLVGNVTMAAGSSIAPGESSALGSIGTLTMSSLTVNGGDLKFNLVNPAGSDLIKVNGAANFNAASTITPNGGTAGTYTVLTSTSPITYGATPTLTPFVDPLTRPATYALDTTSTPTELKLTVTGGSKALTWTGAAGNGNWDMNTTTNWTDGAIAEKFFNNDTVLFGDGPTNRTITIVGSVLPGALEVNNSQGNDYTFTGAGGIGGSVGILKNGGGKLTFRITIQTPAQQQSTLESWNSPITGNTRQRISDQQRRFRNQPHRRLNVFQPDRRRWRSAAYRYWNHHPQRGRNSTSAEPWSVTAPSWSPTPAGGNSSLGSLVGSQVTINAGGAIDLAGNAGGNLNFGSQAVRDRRHRRRRHRRDYTQRNRSTAQRLPAGPAFGECHRRRHRPLRYPRRRLEFRPGRVHADQESARISSQWWARLVSDGNIVINEGVFCHRNHFVHRRRRSNQHDDHLQRWNDRPVLQSHWHNHAANDL